MQTIPAAMVAADVATQAELDAATTARDVAIAAALVPVGARVTTLEGLKLTSGAAQATTSGTTKDYTGIPAGTKRITVSFAGLSTNGSSVLILQLGTGAGIETSGYLGASGLLQNASASVAVALSSGFAVVASTNAATVSHGAIVLTLLDAATNTWVAAGVCGASNAAVPNMLGGSKALAGTLDRVRLTATNGSDTFDAGLVNIMYE